MVIICSNPIRFRRLARAPLLHMAMYLDEGAKLEATRFIEPGVQDCIFDQTPELESWPTTHAQPNKNPAV